MPEIPDLEVFSKNLDKLLRGKKLLRIAGNVKDARGKKTSVKVLKGQKFLGSYRDGKQIFFRFHKGNLLAFHLMLHGEFHMPPVGEKMKLAVIELEFTGKTRLVITDWQKNANATVDPQPAVAPDVMSKEFNLAYLRRIMKSRKIIKELLRDQSRVRGLGNAYTDEILWEARISPFSKSEAIPVELAPVLLRKIRKVLNAATRHIMKKDPHRITGELRDFLKIHNAGREMSPTGFPILRVKKGSSKTYYTEEQVLYK